MKSFFKNKKESKHKIFEQIEQCSNTQHEANNILHRKVFTVPSYKVVYLSDVMKELSNIISISENKHISYTNECNKDIMNIYNEHHNLLSTDWNDNFKALFSKFQPELLKEIYSSFPVVVKVMIRGEDKSFSYFVQNTTARIYTSIAERNNLYCLNTIEDGAVQLYIIGDYYSFIKFKEFISAIEMELEEDENTDECSKYLYKVLSFIPDSITELPDIRSYRAALDESESPYRKQNVIPIPLKYVSEKTSYCSYHIDSNKMFNTINIIHLFNMGHIVKELGKYIHDCEQFRIITLSENSHIIIISSSWLLYNLLSLLSEMKEIGYQTKQFIKDDLLEISKPSAIVKDDTNNNHLSNQEEYSTYYIEGVDEPLE